MMRTLSLALLLGLVAQPSLATTFTVEDSTGPWLGFMNVSELPANGGGFVFGSGWGVPDITASFDDGAGTLTISPNTIGDPDPFWYIGGGAPGNPGNKIMEANLFIQVQDDNLAGTTVNFEGEILSNTYTAAHEGFIFIRDFAPDFSSFNETIVPASVGAFSISLALDPGLGRNIQYGFQSIGENVWITDVAPFGSFVVGTGVIPEPATALLVLAAAPLAMVRRR